MSGPPTWATGNVPQASDFDEWFQPSAAYKASDTARTTTTPSADPDLQVTFVASASYLFTAYLLYTAANGGDLQWNFSGFSGGATLRYAPIRNNLSNAFNGAFADTGGSTETAVGQGGTTLMNVVLVGTLTTGTSGGTMVLNWAQNASNATATTMKAQSALVLQRIA